MKRDRLHNAGARPVESERRIKIDRGRIRPKYRPDLSDRTTVNLTEWENQAGVGSAESSKRRRRDREVRNQARREPTHRIVEDRINCAHQRGAYLEPDIDIDGLEERNPSVGERE